MLKSAQLHHLAYPAYDHHLSNYKNLLTDKMSMKLFGDTYFNSYQSLSSSAHFQHSPNGRDLSTAISNNILPLLNSNGIGANNLLNSEIQAIALNINNFSFNQT